MYTRALVIVAGILVPLALGEWYVRSSLFDKVSYTNSISLDSQLESIRSGGDWNTLFIGSSEVRWGISPADFDRAANEVFAEEQSAVRSFNFGIDGFSPGLAYRVLEQLPVKTLFPELSVVIVGVNLAETNYISDSGYQPGACGALQKPVLTSAFGRDYDLTNICTEDSFGARVSAVFEHSGVMRHRQSLRDALLGRSTADFIPMQSNGLPHQPDGFQPHLSLAESRANFQSSWDRVLLEKEEYPERFAPLAADVWEGIVNDHQFFDRWVALGEQVGVKVVFFALPTSPMFYEAYERRDNYTHNSALLRDWSKATGGHFLDLGIQDQLDVEHHYSDHRHLSQYGAPEYSARLGHAYATRFEGSGVGG